MYTIEADNNNSEDEEAKPLNPEQHDKDGVLPAEHTKKVLLCENVPDRTVTIGRGLEEAECDTSGVSTLKYKSSFPIKT